MRLHRLFFFLLAVSIVWSLPGVAFAQSGGESIRLFQSIATLGSDRRFMVTETIDYDFGDSEHHGIERYIPVKYRRDGGAYRLDLELESVTMDGEPAPYKVLSRSPQWHIRIGDPDAVVTGAHRYVIVYETSRAINFFKDHAELYWNVTGNGWNVPIENAVFSIVGPPELDANASQAACFIGAEGSQDQTACRIATQANTAQFESRKTLDAKEGLTVVLSFPPGLIAEPTFKERVMQIVSDNWMLALPFIVFGIMFFWWWKYGKEPSGKGTVIPFYEPPRSLRPMEADGLAKQSVGNTAVTATILDLAQRGYLKLIYGEKAGLLGSSKQAFSFQKLREAGEELRPFERTVFDGLFTGTAPSDLEVSLEDLKGSFYTFANRSKEEAMASLTVRRYFVRSPAAVRAGFIVGAVVIGGLGFWLASSLDQGALGIGSVIVSAAIVAIFGFFMPAKTKEGAVALEEVEGFKWFLSVTEKDRMSFHNAPELKPETFHVYLPFAIVFGVENQWAKQFEGMNVPPPSYASGYSTWNTMFFVHSMHTLDTQASSVAYTAPSSAGSGGSGFSGGGVGGGFGGGGGGSW